MFYNKVILIGRPTQDPDLRFTPNGTGVATFTLAVDRPYTDKDGQRPADFIRIICWRKLAEVVAQYLKKGELAAVDGRLQVRSYENKEGRRVYVTEVVAEKVRFLQGKKSPAEAVDDDPFRNDDEPLDISEDDLPF